MQAQHRAFLIAALVAACTGGDVEFPGDTGQGGTAGSGNGSGPGSGAGGSGEGGSGQGGQGGAKTCNLLTDALDACGEGYYCEAEGCAEGVCAPIPDSDDPVHDVVCGCDDVSYWNANTAAAHGVSVAKRGACEMPIRCDGLSAAPCPQDQHFCGKIHDDGALACSNDAGGVCWGMPKECTELGFALYRPCISAGNSGCLMLCDAIKAETHHYLDQTCPQ